MNIINEIREKQNQLILMINTTFDELVRKVENLPLEDNENETEFQSIYPITSTAVFKGKKPIAVKIGNQRIIAPTWKKVVENILQTILKDERMKRKMLNLRDILLGRVRTRVSKNSDNMRSPLKLCDELYIETHYDTETLMNLLLEILNKISYDYNNIQVVIKSNNRL